MNINTGIVGIVALIIGLGGGYMLAGNTTEAPTGGHVMPEGSTMSDAMAGMTSGLEGKTGDEFDRAFIEGMIVHHEGAVAMAEQALQTAKHPEIKHMAQEIIAAQTREIETMRGWLQAWFVSPSAM
jgi:uncharacterized protein (DUF305 family)